MSSESHEVFKELSAAINDLSNDMVTGLVSLRAVSSDNKAGVERVERRFERAVESLQGTAAALGRKEAAAETRLAALEKAAEKAAEKVAHAERAEGQLRVESTKGRWMFWVAVVGGSFGFATTVLQILAAALGWGGN